LNLENYPVKLCCVALLNQTKRKEKQKAFQPLI